jgi:hypothetical protein
MGSGRRYIFITMDSSLQQEHAGYDSRIRRHVMINSKQKKKVARQQLKYEIRFVVPQEFQTISRSPKIVPRLDGSASSCEILFLSGLSAVHFTRDSLKHISTTNMADYTSPEWQYDLSYFSHIPSRLDYGTTLSLTVDCVAVGFRQLFTQDSYLQSNSLTLSSKYTQALRKLRRVLSDPVESLKEETLCSAVLLCLFEVGIQAS